MRGGNAQDRRRARRAAERRFERAVRNQPVETVSDEEIAQLIAAAEAAAAEPPLSDEGLAEISQLVAAAEGATCANCSHTFSDHVGASGPCTYEDGRGTCSCASYAAASAETGVLPEVLAMERFDSQFPDLFQPGDVTWTPQEGFVDLVADFSLNAGERVADISVRLDKALIQTDEGLKVAAITINDDGDPVLASASSWTPVEGGTGTTAGQMRLWLTEFNFAPTADVALPDEHRPGQRIPKRNASPGTPTPPAGAADAGGAQWTALFLPEGALTDDGRAFAPGSVKWRELPLTLMAMTETSAQGGHDGAEVTGRIDQIWRDGHAIRASGVFDEGDFGSEIARMVADGVLRGLSVDTAIHEYEVGPRSDYFDEDGNWLTEKPETAAPEDPDLLDLLFGDDSERIFVVTDAVIGMATVCPFPAFAEANISLVASGGGAVWRYTSQAGFITTPGELEPIVASGFGDRPAGTVAITDDAPPSAADGLTAGAAGLAPVKPPAAWFENPELEELTPLTITEDGRIFGHAWSWQTCHISFPDQCVLAPHTGTDNSYFHLGEIECEDGASVAVGKITLDTGHAGPRASRVQAAAHYDDTGTVAAHIRVGEDSYGGWVAGAVSPELSEEKLRVLRGAVLSGDWRAVRMADGSSNLELVALLAVNVPGFPVPRQPKMLAASGADGVMEPLALTAAGIVVEPTEEDFDLAAVATLAASVECQDCPS